VAFSITTKVTFLGFSFYIGYKTAFEAGIMVFIIVLGKTHSKEWNNIWLEGDSHLVIKVIYHDSSVACKMLVRKFFSFNSTIVFNFPHIFIKEKSVNLYMFRQWWRISK